MGPGNKKMLRSSLANPNAVQLVALSARADDDGAGNQDGVFSEVFGVSAAPRVATAQPSHASSNDSAIIAAAVGITVGVAALVALVVVVVIVRKRKNESRERAGSDTPLPVVVMSSNDFN